MLFIDRTGVRYGRLVAIQFLGKRKWRCICDCGKTVVVFTNNLNRGHTKSCGCLKEEPTNFTHLMSGSPEHQVWSHMIQRCTNPRNKSYANYGGRGIVVCSEWRESFEQFYKDMGTRPERHSIERIDVNGNYCPENCKWIPLSLQNSNKRNTTKYLYEGEMLSLKQIVARTGLPKTTVFRWLKAGVPLTKPTWQRFDKAS